jgi:two-component system, OmpR family, response regulator VicR
MPDASKRILIVDDEKDVCEVLRFKFEKAGFQVQTAFDGVDGSEKVVRFEPHCILLDIRMPREDGLTFLRKLRAYREEDSDKQTRIRQIPVIVLTAASPHMKSLFQAEGISDYMEKPFDFTVLKDKVLQVAFPAK